MSDSIRVPETFRELIKTSFGHLIFTGMSVVWVNFEIVLATAMPETRDISPSGELFEGIGRAILQNKFPSSEIHFLSNRPRPAVCRLAQKTVKGSPPFSMCFFASLFVLSVSSRTISLSGWFRFISVFLPSIL